MPDRDAAKAEFDENGFTFVRGLFDAAVAERLKCLSVEDPVMADRSQGVLDGDGRVSRLTLWYEPGDDVFGRLSCSDRLTDTMAVLLGGEASFFHAKLMNKEPRVGGRWEWHQDYGYWHDDGFPRADMGSCFVALDPCTTANGCLRIVPGSHRHGRLDHGPAGEQRGADGARVRALIARHGTLDCEMAPGDALFFHANLLHASGPNLSDRSRLGLISCFFRRDNESTRDDPRYRARNVPRVPHEAVLEGAAGLDAGLRFMRRDA